MLCGSVGGGGPPPNFLHLIYNATDGVGGSDGPTHPHFLILFWFFRTNWPFLIFLKIRVIGKINGSKNSPVSVARFCAPGFANLLPP